MTLGEDRVGINFNPSNNPAVGLIKQKAAELIDLCDAMKKDADAEKLRLIALAQTHFEDAAMWAVKAATRTPW
jgi:hypothetical protein